MVDQPSSPGSGHWPSLTKLLTTDSVLFEEPVKKIHDGTDVDFFLRSVAYRRIIDFLQQLNLSMRPGLTEANDEDALPPSVQKIGQIIKSLETTLEKVPPDPGPRRFGNVSFRKWMAIVETKVPGLIQPLSTDATVELEAYLLGSFGSAQRLDYGTGHELSFLAFLAGIWLTHGFDDVEDIRQMSRAMVEGAVKPYLSLVRKLISTYTLEPAGSHGVWGLDDHSFLPYILGSAQYCPPIDLLDPVPVDLGSAAGSPPPGDVAQRSSVDRLRGQNIYFDAIAFIYDVKTGPFWEHSPILFDISGVRDGWAKINKGMMKMYVAEVLSKFPVVQHFPFGKLFPWEEDPLAPKAKPTAHSTSLLRSRQSGATSSGPSAPDSAVGTRAPWASSSSARNLPTGGASSRANEPSAAPEMTRAPWAR